MSKTYI